MPTAYDTEMLNRFGPTSKPLPLPTLDVPDFVKEQFLASQQAPQKSRMDQVFDSFMNEQLRVPMNIKALAGMNPQVASEFLNQQGGLQQSNRMFGSSPEEREQRNRLVAATQLGGNYLGAQAGMADATARQNVGMRAADANFLGGMHGNVTNREIAGENRSAATERARLMQEFLTNRDKAQYDREDTRHKESRDDTKRAGMFSAVQSGAASEMARIDNAEKQALQELQDAANRGYITEDEAIAHVRDLQAKAEDARNQVRSQLSQANMGYQSGGNVNMLNPADISKIRPPRQGGNQYERAAFQKVLENKLAEAQGGWTMSGGLPHKQSRQQAFLSSVDNDFPDQKMLQDFVQKKFGQTEDQSGVQTAIRNLALAAPTFGVSMLPGVSNVTDEVAEFLGMDTERSRRRKLGR